MPAEVKAWVAPAAMAAAGLLVAAGVIRAFDLRSVLAAIRPVGGAGFGLLIGVQVLMGFPLGVAWWLAAPGVAAKRVGAFIWGSLMAEAASNLLPFSQLGGAIIGSRATMLGGVPSAMAMGSNVVDVTMELAAQLLYTLLGVGLLAHRLQWAPRASSPLLSLVVGVVIATGLVAGLLTLQRRGLSIIEGVARWVSPGAAKHAAAVMRAVETSYGQGARLWACLGVHLASWLAAAAVTWLMLALMGRPLPLVSVITLESLVFAIRNAAFVVPGALGVQEGAYALLGPLVGLPPEAGLALALLKRARDITIAAPMLFSWQAVEWRRRWRRKAARRAAFVQAVAPAPGAAHETGAAGGGYPRGGSGRLPS